MGANYYEKNRERIRAYQKEYYDLNRDKIVASKKQYRIDNRKKVREYGKKYRKENRELRRFRNNRSLSERMGLTTTLTLSEWENTLKLFDNKCVYCGKPWEQMDHIIPKCIGGGYTKENIVPSCKKCNQSKNNKLPQEFCNEELINSIIEKLEEYG
jgi:5-methylcytosine-specific restriction endonuclease McrA